VKGERGGGGQQAIEDVVGVGCKANEEQKLWSLFDCADDAVYAGVRLEPPTDRLSEERPRSDEDYESTCERCKVGDDSACPCAKRVSRQHNEGGI
jgi:hypothetical protein